MTDDQGHVVPGIRRVGPPRARTEAALVATTMAAVLGLAACGGATGPGVASGEPSTTRPASTSVSSGASHSNSGSNSQMLAFSQCIRRHGVPNFPDPNGSGDLPASAKRIASSNPHQFEQARSACSDLLPNGGNGPTQAQWQQILSEMVNFARCMRHHGVPNWPDPTYDTNGRPVFNINVDPNSPQFSAEIHACRGLLHDYGSRPGWPDLSNYFQYNRG